MRKRGRADFEEDCATAERAFRSEYRHYRTRKQTRPDLQAIQERTLAQMMKANMAELKGKAKQEDHHHHDKENTNNLNTFLRGGAQGKAGSALGSALHPHHQRIEVDLRMDRNEAGLRLKDGRCAGCSGSAQASILPCAFCERDTCVQCLSRCESCDGVFCRLCSTTSYAGREEASYCLDCSDAISP